MITKRTLIVVAMLGIFSSSIVASGKYEVVKIWPEAPHGWHFYRPQAIAVDQAGNVYVADSGNHRIKKFDPEGRFITQWGSAGEGNGQLGRVHAIGVDGSNTVYVADQIAEGEVIRIQKFTAYGEFKAKWSSAVLSQFRAIDLAFDSHGNVLITTNKRTEPRDFRVQKFTSDGKLLAHWGSKGDGDGQFDKIAGITVDEKGNIYVGDLSPRIQKFDPNGQFVTKWNVPGWSMDADREGNIYTIGSDGIVKLDAEGRCLAKWDPRYEGKRSSQRGRKIAVDTCGHIYLHDYDAHKVVKLDSNGYVVAQWGNAGSGAGEFDCPGSIAVDADGSVIVADVRNKRIQKFDPEGKPRRQWGGGYRSYIDVMAVDRSGYIYASGGTEIYKLNTDGKQVASWGGKGDGDGQFQYIGGIAVDNSGNVYVSDESNYRIQKFTSDGRFVTKWGGQGKGNRDEQFGNPWPMRMAVNPEGHILVMDQVKAEGSRIKEFDPNGKFITQWSVPSTLIDLDQYGNTYGWGKIGVDKYDIDGRLVATFGRWDGKGGDMSNVQDVAVDASGYTYIVTLGRRRTHVKKFDPNGKAVTTWKLDDTGVPSPWAITVDTSGNVYVASGHNTWIHKLASDGVLIARFQVKPPLKGKFAGLGGVAVGVSGNVYAVDTRYPQIQKFDSDGEFIMQWADPSAGESGLQIPAYVAVDGSGSTYVTDELGHCIHKFDAQGKFIKSWGSKGTGDAQFNMPEGIAVDKSGNVYVCDRQNCRIQKFDSNGRFLGKWGKEGSSDGEFHFPAAVALDKEGDVYVADSDNHRVQKFTADGKFITEWGEFGEAPGQLNVPLGIAVDAAGNVYVSDSHNHRIQKFAPVSAG